ncbi:hypothetical protein [Actinomadura roseirufa]|uniref:hypothetical protein n=1 Tax=Actinomadura roseirufa TaxID=2094049 RepID=UPI0010414F75|nr:hypothetical protein [Actinomadura roseirufa]
MDDVARARAVPVPLRRVLRRLLAVAGLVIAGWLLGGVAHADELPATSEIVERAAPPVLGRVVNQVVTPSVPMPVSVPEVARRPVVMAPVPDAHAAPVQAVPARHRRPAKAPVPLPRAHAPRVQRPHLARSAGVRKEKAAPQMRRVRHTPAPVAPAHAPADSRSKIGGLSPSGGPVGLPGAPAWALGRPRVSPPPALRPVPPAVRTAADEPSFAPD